MEFSDIVNETASVVAEKIKELRKKNAHPLDIAAALLFVAFFMASAAYEGFAETMNENKHMEKIKNLKYIG